MTVAFTCTDERDPSGSYTGTTFCGLDIIFETSGTPPQATELFETREVDPLVYDEDPSGAPTFAVRATMPSGASVTFTGALVRDPETQVAPTQPGYQVLVFRPANPSALQEFIDQYWDVVSSFSIESSVSLIDVSGGETRATQIHMQVSGPQGVEYLGSVSWSPPSYKERFHNLDPETHKQSRGGGTAGPPPHHYQRRCP